MSFDASLANGMGVFSAVVDGGSFVRAAEALELTPSGVSRAIARLEKRLGIRLFDRTTRMVTLTDEGRRFTEKSRRCWPVSKKPPTRHRAARFK